MTHLSKLAISAIAVALVAAGAGAGYAIGHKNDDGKTTAASRPSATVLGERLEASTTTSAPSTSTTAAVQAGSAGAQPSTPTTSLTPAQTSTVTVATQSGTTTPPATSPPATAGGGACGTGSSSATARARITPVEPRAGTDYRTDVSVDVQSNMDRAIELDRIVVRLVFHDGSSETHALAVAGTVMQPNEKRTFSASYVTHPPPDGVSLADFAWHTAGQPQCVGRAA